MEILHGDCRERLRELIERGVQVDSIVTDPPYNLGFMNKSWDKDGISNDVEMWKLCIQVLKPGGHLLSFGGTRTYHRMASAIEDAGFEIRDCVSWIYGSGFPKSLDISKKIDQMEGVERGCAGVSDRKNGETGFIGGDCVPIVTTPCTDAAKQWSGWGTALKPSHEPVVLARKPLSEKTVAENVLKHGCGGINVDGCRVSTNGKVVWKVPDRPPTTESIYIFEGSSDRSNTMIKNKGGQEGTSLGRFPANLIHDGSDEVEAEFAKYGERKSGGGDKSSDKLGYHGGARGCGPKPSMQSTGSASRFFYCAKASKRERDNGLENFDAVHRANGNKWTDQDYRVSRGERPQSAESGPRRNVHPTVKPLALMRYLCRLITPPNGTVLDPFLGSGSTGIAAKLEGFNFIGIEKELEYIEIAKARIGV